MEKMKRRCFAGFLAFIMFLGVFTILSETQVQAAANKALQIKVSFNGKRDSDKAYDQNNYVVTTGYKGTTKLKSGMTFSAKVYVPVAALKKDGDTVHIDNFINLNKKVKKEYQYVGSVNSNYTVMLMKAGKKIKLARWNISKEKEEKIGNYATYEKSGKYYVITLKNVPLKNKYIDVNGKSKKLDTSSTFMLSQGVSVVGTCSKVSGYVYLDNLQIKGTAKTISKITFNSKDYEWTNAYRSNAGKEVKVSIKKVS